MTPTELEQPPIEVRDLWGCQTRLYGVTCVTQGEHDAARARLIEALLADVRAGWDVEAVTLAQCDDGDDVEERPHTVYTLVATLIPPAPASTGADSGGDA